MLQKIRCDLGGQVHGDGVNQKLTVDCRLNKIIMGSAVELLKGEKIKV